MITTVKTCTKCGATKPLAEFHTRREAPDGHRNECKICIRAAVQKNYRENRGHYGTVGCAAGHCMLDPWFKRRGLGAVKVSEDIGLYWVTPGELEMVGFFGTKGYDNIFMGWDSNYAETVGQIKDYIKELKA